MNDEYMKKSLNELKRCNWVSDDIHIKYHDTEWGIPLHDDGKLFEFLILDGIQSGLSWKIILNKRNSFRTAFNNFDPKKISLYEKKDVQKLLSNEEIIRNERKIKSVINNAKRFLEIQKEFGSFDSYVWSFVHYTTRKNTFRKWSDVPVSSEESKIMSHDMKKRGFSFVGPVVCYAFMQTVGMVNDHLVGCFRRNQC
jgi:DNA-3-methyladenine glycosylase I